MFFNRMKRNLTASLSRITMALTVQIFKGELNHITKCLKCKERNESRSFFWVLPLAIEDLHGHIYSVEKGVEAFFKGEKVSGDDKMYCNRCNKKEDAVLVQPPLFGAENDSLRSCTAYLLMYKKGVDAEGRQDETERGELPHQLNDGSCYGGGNMKLLNAPCVKPDRKDSGADGDSLLSHKSDFPTLQKSHKIRQQLDRNSEEPMQLLHTRGKHSEHLGTHEMNHVLEQSTKKTLEFFCDVMSQNHLYALVNHFGNLTGGHYTAHIKSIETDTWYHFNDNIVNLVQPPLFGASNDSLRSCTAYLLMYKKVRRHPEQNDESEDDFLSHSGVDAEGRQDETERGELPVPHHQLNHGSCYGGGNLKHLNAPCVKPGRKDSGADGDCLQSHKSDFPTLQKSHKIRQQLDRNSEEPMQLLHTRGKHSEHLGTHEMNHVLEQSTKKTLEVNETVWGTQKAKGSLRNRDKHVEAEEHLCSSDVKSLPVSSSSSLTNLKGHRPIKVCMQPSIKCNNPPKQCRKSNNSMKDGETMQHVVIADCTQTVRKGGKSPEDRGQSEKSRDRDKRAPWK
ncbi:Ubiquitin carboxyl-terminal hydrolase 4 [Dissostichus eleginoides]|uniref:Ubiquitin carboxyl-terminal hydrolase 4 n=1 Tax=Dissostichus eleginoides TaxID=100907 RepID=A0AAD9BWQ5_DISEL|nr:Ubiquitin carboxyl-terminal hydrolase 4 [Dissostichus eleginoides]